MSSVNLTENKLSLFICDTQFPFFLWGYLLQELFGFMQHSNVVGQ